MIKSFSVCEVKLIMEYLKIFLSAFGGGMAVVVATILFAKNRIEKLIDKKIVYHFDTKLENEKGIIEQKIYVSQHKFEKEYEIIQELMEKTFDFTYLSWEVYSTIEESDKDDSALKKYKKMCDYFTLFYMKNCAFIPEELAKPFDLFVKKINEFRSAAKGYNELLVKVVKKDSTSNTEDILFQTFSNTMKTIHDEINKNSDYSHDKLVEVTRKHYEKLDIK